MKRYTGTIPALVSVEFYAENEAQARDFLRENSEDLQLDATACQFTSASLSLNGNQREVIESDYLHIN